jgi:hypothetical protein
MKNKDNNIINFPLEKRMSIIAREDEDKLVEKFQEYYEIESFVESILENLVLDLIETGISIDEEKYVFDISFLYESIKSLIYKHHQIDHPFQIMCKELYSNFVENENQLEFDF